MISGWSKASLPDGSYTIEVRASPKISEKQRAALNEVRQKGDRYEMRKLMTEIGFNPSAMAHAIYLGVSKGAFINPVMEEEPTGKNMGALEKSLDIESVQLTGRRWDAAYLPNQSTGHVTPADATSAGGQPTLTASTETPPFTQAGTSTAAWYEATFQNIAEDGSPLTYQGFLRPAALDGTAKVFHAYFRQMEGTIPGPWQQGYFRAEENGYRFMNHTEATQPAQTPAFDYVTQNDAPQDNPPQDPLGATLPDFVINDDLIVDGSACIGFDCVNGESFGFDTIRLKENNLRIKFDDTSVAASFPRTDWQLTANASANGGASKFSIDDISGSRTPFTVEANARSHSLYVDDGGRIGNRTSTPSVEIHTIDGDTPTLRLQQDGSSGFAPQTWDVAGNETNFFIRDVTNGSTLPFRIRPSAPTSSIFIDVDGDVGFGTASPDGSLHAVETAGAAADVLILENNGPTRILLDNTASSGDSWRINHANDGVLRFAENTDAGAETEFALETDGDLTITGAITTDGPTCAGGCDAVFAPDFEVPSIEEHAAQMWTKGYLPAIGPTLPQEPMNLTEKTGGILNELEHAHIYIEQLHKRMLVQQETIEQQQKLMETLLARLAALEANQEAGQEK